MQSKSSWENHRINNSLGPFSALYHHQHINQKSPFHMIMIDRTIVLSNGMPNSITDYELLFISYKVYGLRFFV
jgi:hypothetical protein